jgi:hypothetical protein
MLQVLHLDVLKVDRVLYLLAFCCLDSVSPHLPTLARHPSSSLPLVDADDVQGDADPVWARETAWKTDCKHG